MALEAIYGDNIGLFCEKAGLRSFEVHSLSDSDTRK